MDAVKQMRSEVKKYIDAADAKSGKDGACHAGSRKGK